MDHLVFFKENESFKNLIDKIKLSYDRSYTTYHPILYDQISKVLLKSKDILLFYFAENLSEIDRIRLKSLVADLPSIKICLLSDVAHALDAWKLNLFHFEEYPISSSKILNTYRKYVISMGGIDKELVLKHDGELVKIPFAHMNYLQAAGNYTMIYQRNDKILVQTKQLGTYEFLCEKDLNFNRVHRSLILNLANVKTIGHREILFYNTNKALGISESLKYKLIREMLGK